MENSKIQFEEFQTREGQDHRELMMSENGSLIGLITSYSNEDGKLNYVGLDKQFRDYTIHHDLEELKKQMVQKIKDRRKNRLLELNQTQERQQKRSITKDR